MFNSAFNRPATIPSPQGNGERSIFEERVVDGIRELVITGKESIKDLIEASKDETLIENILKRFQSGDITALSKKQGFYADITGLPDNHIAAHKFIKEMENKYNSYSDDIKSKFGSFESYIEAVANMSSDEFVNIFYPNSETVATDEGGASDE